MSEKNQFQVSKLHTSHISQSMSLFLVIVSQELLQVQISTSHGLKLEVLGLEGGLNLSWHNYCIYYISISCCLSAEIMCRVPRNICY